MHDATSPSPRLRLAVAPGVASAQLSALLARQRAEEPGVILSFHEVAGDALLEGLHEGRYDVGVSSQGGSDLQDYPIYRWQAETCSLLDEMLASLMPTAQKIIQRVTSFEMMALWVAAGYGIGVSARSRIERALGWGIAMRPPAEGPYEIVTYLQRPHAQADSVSERFERRALQIARADAA